MKYTHKIDWNKVNNFEEFKAIFAAQCVIYIDPLTVPNQFNCYLVPMTTEDHYNCAKEEKRRLAFENMLRDYRHKDSQPARNYTNETAGRDLVERVNKDQVGSNDHTKF